MLFNLHADYVKAVGRRPEEHAAHARRHRRAKAPPGRLRRLIAGGLVAVARRVDHESGQRATAS